MTWIICQTLFHQNVGIENLPNFNGIKVSWCMVIVLHIYWKRQLNLCVKSVSASGSFSLQKPPLWINPFHIVFTFCIIAVLIVLYIYTMINSMLHVESFGVQIKNIFHGVMFMHQLHETVKSFPPKHCVHRFIQSLLTLTILNCNIFWSQ